MFLIALAQPMSAQAQLAGTLSLHSNEMFRGESISSDQPSISLGLNFDGPGGTFIGASTSLTGGSDGPRINTATQYAGIATRRGNTSFEAGVVHRSYDRLVDLDYRKGFFEGYVGLTHRTLRARLYVSPDYLRQGPPTYYLDLNAHLLQLGQWSLDGHGGLSLIPTETEASTRKLQDFEDWRLQVSRPLGKRLNFSVGLNASNYPVYSDSGRVRAFASVSTAF